MPDTYDTCGIENKTISCLYGVTKTSRIDIGGYPALLKFTFVSIVQGGIGNAAQLILRGGTQAGYNIVYYGAAPRGGGTFDLSTYIMTQDVNYIDVEFAHLTGGDTTAEYTLTYKIECPIAIGERIDLHWSPDTTGHSCDSMYIPSGGSGDEAWAGYSGFLPYLVEGGSLSIGKKIFGLPTVLTAKTDFGNDVWMTSNDRNLQYGSVPMPYHSALPLV